MAQVNALGLATTGIQSFDGTSVYTGRTITAGANIEVTNGDGTGGNPTIATTAAQLVTAYTDVNSTPYVVAAGDNYLSVDTTTLAITVQLPNAPATGRIFTIKDRIGNASGQNITVTTVGGAVNIDGATTYPIVNDYDSINVLFNGTSYEVW